MPKIIKLNPIIKAQAGINTKKMVELLRAENLAYANKASAYFSSTPTIGNLVRGAYNWYMSQPYLGGHSETSPDPITGVAPVSPFKKGTQAYETWNKLLQLRKFKEAGGVKEALRRVEAIKNRTSINATSKPIIAKGDSWDVSIVNTK